MFKKMVKIYKKTPGDEVFLVKLQAVTYNFLENDSIARVSRRFYKNSQSSFSVKSLLTTTSVAIHY